MSADAFCSLLSGNKILLRLRTDDLQGFRKILSIRKVRRTLFCIFCIFCLFCVLFVFIPCVSSVLFLHGTARFNCNVTLATMSGNTHFIQQHSYSSPFLLPLLSSSHFLSLLLTSHHSHLLSPLLFSSLSLSLPLSSYHSHFLSFSPTLPDPTPPGAFPRADAQHAQRPR